MQAAADTEDRPRLIPLALATGVPFACYLATASAHGYWLDAGEFVAAGTELGIPHPPGHPLASIVFSAATLIPLGPIPLRIALVSALMAAVAGGFLYRATEHTLRAAGLTQPSLMTPVALGATWLVTTSGAWWLQAVRPEVYALQAALIGIVLERFIAIEARAPVTDLRPLYVAHLALGFALANHHFLALLVLPAIAPTMARVFAGRGPKPLLWSALSVSVGLLTYAYLPLRALASPTPNLGAPTTLERFFWVVSAQAFQKNTGEGVPQPLWERFADVAVHAVASVHWITVLMALGGLYLMLRLPRTRRVAAIWGIVLVVFVAGRAWLGFVRDNPDALGYLMPAFGALSVLAAGFVALVLRRWGPRAPAFLVALAIAAGGLAHAPAGAADASLARFSATDAFDDPLRRDLPARAVVIAHAPQTIFRFWGGEGSERLRPDVTLVPVPFLTYPGMVDALVAEEPRLTPVLRGYLLEGELRQPDIQSLAAERPLLVEMDPRVPPGLYETLVPAGLYHAVIPDGATESDERLGASSTAHTWEAIYALIGNDMADPRTRDQLLWRHYTEALYYAGFGDLDRAIAAAERGLLVSPASEELQGLVRAARAAQEADETPRRHPLDVTPFLLR